MIGYAEETIFKLNGRKEEFESLEKDERTITTIFGSISFNRRYYKDLETNKRIYLVDQYFELKPNERLLQNVEAKIIDEATISSYAHAGETAVYGEYEKYKELADKDDKVIFGGRLGQYKYYDMDKVIEEAFNYIKKELK